MNIPVLDCLRCTNPLTLKETKAKEHYCEKCRKVVEAEEHRQKLGNDIHRANRVFR